MRSCPKPPVRPLSTRRTSKVLKLHTALLLRTLTRTVRREIQLTHAQFLAEELLRWALVDCGADEVAFFDAVEVLAAVVCGVGEELIGVCAGWVVN